MRAQLTRINALAHCRATGRRASQGRQELHKATVASAAKMHEENRASHAEPFDLTASVAVSGRPLATPPMPATAAIAAWEKKVPTFDARCTHPRCKRSRGLRAAGRAGGTVHAVLVVGGGVAFILRRILRCGTLAAARLGTFCRMAGAFRRRWNLHNLVVDINAEVNTSEASRIQRRCERASFRASPAGFGAEARRQRRCKDGRRSQQRHTSDASLAVGVQGAHRRPGDARLCEQARVDGSSQPSRVVYIARLEREQELLLAFNMAAVVAPGAVMETACTSALREHVRKRPDLHIRQVPCSRHHRDLHRPRRCNEGPVARSQVVAKTAAPSAPLVQPRVAHRRLHRGPPLNVAG
mmetsp:Transcript_61643/g.121303  ORF Transcript_61643/g.121303 Transcript_61643/m.121303 type:complete len:354 (-) Transcript_61643:520-1581(-)